MTATSTPRMNLRIGVVQLNPKVGPARRLVLVKRRAVGLMSSLPPVICRLGRYEPISPGLGSYAASEQFSRLPARERR